MSKRKYHKYYVRTPEAQAHIKLMFDMLFQGLEFCITSHGIQFLADEELSEQACMCVVGYKWGLKFSCLEMAKRDLVIFEAMNSIESYQ